MSTCRAAHALLPPRRRPNRRRRLRQPRCFSSNRPASDPSPPDDAAKAALWPWAGDPSSPSSTGNGSVTQSLFCLFIQINLKFDIYSSLIFCPLTAMKWYRTTRMKSDTPMMLAKMANCMSVIILTVSERGNTNFYRHSKRENYGNSCTKAKILN